MKDKQSYSYVVLRYVHEILSAEFVNVGVVMYVPAQGRMIARARNTMGPRLRGVFPDLDRPAFLNAMSNVRRGLNKISKRKIGGLLRSEGSALTLAREAVPPDDSSLQWSPVGGGWTADAQQTFERLYSQFVSRYDTKSRHRRTDEDVWRPVLVALGERNLETRLQEKVISGELDDVTFKHAWKNGKWNVYEPLSFDLAEAESIKAKAREWVGHLSAVVAKGQTEPFQPHFLVGAPANPVLGEAYERAKRILLSAPNQPQIFEEDQVEQLVDQIEDEVHAHEHS